MPLYDMKCTKCNKIHEVFCKISEMDNQRCPNCKSRLKSQITNFHNQDWFRPHWNENFGINPVYVETKGQYKDLCLKYNVTSRALGDVRNIREI